MINFLSKEISMVLFFLTLKVAPTSKKFEKLCFNLFRISTIQVNSRDDEQHFFIFSYFKLSSKISPKREPASKILLILYE